jgi:hypothetical protein
LGARVGGPLLFLRTDLPQSDTPLLIFRFGAGSLGARECGQIGEPSHDQRAKAK